MRFLVGVDAEGMACVVGERGKTLSGSKDFEFAKRQATREASAVAHGLFDGGADTVVIWDNHGGSLNLDYHGLDERCMVLCGKGDVRRMSVFDEQRFDGLLLIGYHAMEGTIDGVLAHSFSSTSYQWMRVNGREVGEIAIDSAIAGEAGAPTVLVASDAAGCREAREFLPWVYTVETKRGLARNMALSKSPVAVERELEAAARAAATSIRRRPEDRTGAQTPDVYGRREGPQRGESEFQPFTFAPPVRFEVRFQRADAAEAKARSDRRFSRTDAFTVVADGSSIRDFF